MSVANVLENDIKTKASSNGRGKCEKPNCRKIINQMQLGTSWLSPVFVNQVIKNVQDLKETMNLNCSIL